MLLFALSWCQNEKFTCVFFYLKINVLSLGVFTIGISYFAEGFLSTCSFDYLSKTFDRTFFVTVLFTFAHVVPMMLIIFHYALICKHVFSTRKSIQSSSHENERRITSVKYSSAPVNAEVRITKAEITICFLFVVCEFLNTCRCIFLLLKVFFLYFLIAWTPYR